MLDSQKLLEIENICNRCIAIEFAIFVNEKSQGPCFSWKWWVKHCEDMVDTWIYLNNVSGDTEEIKSAAKLYTKDFAERLLDISEFE